MQITTNATLGSHATTAEIMTHLLSSRGFTTPEAQASFLRPAPVTLDYLYTNSGITAASLAASQSLLDQHLMAGHDICIFGDYDADGVTATAIMYLGLTEYKKSRASTSRLLPFIPDRLKHGYGLSEAAITEVISGSAFQNSLHPDFHPSLIVTVDTGIVANASIATLKAAGIDVLLTDHHLPDAVLPPADQLLHTTTTSGAGVAWIFVAHLLGHTHSLLDLATVGIVADMMPLVGFNRSLVTAGLPALRNTSNLGLQALITRMGIPKRPLSTYDISFAIAPRINAAGRIYSPLDALRLLCTPSARSATALAEKIEAHNTDRQAYTDTALAHAASQSFSHKIITIVGPYHEGVIGLVASKMVEQIYRPVVVLSQSSGDVIKASARSVPGFNITAFLRGLTTPFLSLGGHEAAAGFSIAKANLEALLTEIQERSDGAISDELLVRQLSADLELTLSQANLDLAKALLSLEPYGLGNPKPRFLFRHVAVIEDRELAGGKHHKLTLSQNGVTRPLLMFNTKYEHPLASLTQCLATLDVNVWNNRESVQLVASYVEV